MRRLVALSLTGAALVAAGCGSQADRRADADLARGKELFTKTCGSCHALADAGTQSTVGPNLDDAFGYSRAQGFDESTFFDVTLRQIDIPNENGGMPPDLLEGQDAINVASYIASVAGERGEEQAAGGGEETGATEGGETAEAAPATNVAQGKKVFNSAGCAACHTLADAGAAGTVGPNLDETDGLSVDAVVEQVENGGGAMPPFKGSLSAKQIRAVSEYVVTVAGTK